MRTRTSPMTRALLGCALLASGLSGCLAGDGKAPGAGNEEERQAARPEPPKDRTVTASSAPVDEPPRTESEPATAAALLPAATPADAWRWSGQGAGGGGVAVANQDGAKQGGEERGLLEQGFIVNQPGQAAAGGIDAEGDFAASSLLGRSDSGQYEAAARSTRVTDAASEYGYARFGSPDAGGHDVKLVELQKKVDALKDRTLRTKSLVQLREVVLRGEVAGAAGDAQNAARDDGASEGEDRNGEQDEDLPVGRPGSGEVAEGKGDAGVRILAELEPDIARNKGKKKSPEKPRASLPVPGDVPPSLGPRADSGKDHSGQVALLPANHRVEPERFVPDTCYFANTYLGGNAGYLEQMRRLDDALAGAGAPHRLARMDAESGLEAPPKKGMALSATLSTRHIAEPQRVFLQVSLRGSERYGWRRPPLEVALVLDSGALDGGAEPAVALIRSLLHELGPQDRLGVVLASGAPVRLAELSRIRELMTTLLPQLHTLGAAKGAGPDELAAALFDARSMLAQASQRRTTLPGTQNVLLLTRGADDARVRSAYPVVQALTVDGVVTSVFELGGGTGGAWWRIADVGHGNYHRADASTMAGAVHAELESLSRVVARLLRVNVKLTEGVRAARILGSYVLDDRTVAEVKAREVATDARLSRALGIAADRGDDDDGIQTVVPYFYGGDTHVIVMELWVESPGKVADVTLRYKDMVNLDNAVSRTTVHALKVPRPETVAQVSMRDTLRGFGVATALSEAAERLATGDGDGALRILRDARALLPSHAGVDTQLLQRFEMLLGDGAWRHDPDQRRVLRDALDMAGRRKVGGTEAGS